MLNKNDEFWAALASVINGNPTEEEKTLVDDWLQEDVNNSKILEYFKKIGYNASLDEADELKGEIYLRVQEKIRRHFYKRIVRIWQYVSAACFAALIIIGSLTLPRMFENKNKFLTSYIETQCPPGIKSSVTLSDGSIVELNAGSTLMSTSKMPGM